MIAAAARRPSRRSSRAARWPARELPTDVSAGGHVFITAAIALMFSERYDEAERLTTGAVDDARRRGSSVGFAAASSLRSLLHYRRGALAEAEADAAAALDLRDDVARLAGLPRVRAQLARVHRARPRRGRPSCSTLADDFFATQPSEDLPYSHAMHARGWLRAQLGDLEGGLAELLACGERELEWGVGTPQIIAWRSAAAEVCLTLGRLEQARALAAEEVALARSIGAPRALGVALRAAALAESGARRIELLREARRVAEASQGALELARARIDLGAALVRAGPPRRRARAAARRAGARVRAAARRRWSSARTASCWPPARARAGPRRPAATSSRRASGA